MSEKYFSFEESPYALGKFTLKLDFNKLPLKHTTGSYQLLAARFIGLEWDDYIRMCRDVLGADIVGKGLYPAIYFSKTQTTRKFLELLNKRAEYALHYREHPNIVVELEELKQKKKENENEYN